MTFRNSILAGNKLVREAIESPNFDAGNDGWAVNRDGTAEFNSVTVRGTVESVGPNNTSYLDNGGLGVRANDNTIETFIQNGLIETGYYTVSKNLQLQLDADSFGVRWYGSGVPGLDYQFEFDSGGYLKILGQNWVNFTFQNGWANWGGGYGGCQYRLDALGWVNLRGVAAPGTLAAGTVITTLPVGYRPLAKHQFHYYGGSQTIIEIDSLGQVYIQTPGGHPVASPLAITGFRFPL